MNEQLESMFNDEKIIAKIQKKLPELFQIAELESSRAGKVGMEVGSLRERIVVALLIYKFGEEHVNADIPITKTEIDAEVFGKPVSIKTITGARPGGFKLIWTVDAFKAKEYASNYLPDCDIIFVHINWKNGGGFYYIPMEAQLEVFSDIGSAAYLKLPKSGTNPRGVEISSVALNMLLKNPFSRMIPINWKKEIIEFKPFKRWVELWQQE